MEPKLALTAKFVIPFLHTSESVNISVRQLRYERLGDQSIEFQDGKHVNFIVDLMLKVNKEFGDIQSACDFLGCERINDTAALRESFRRRLTKR